MFSPQLWNKIWERGQYISCCHITFSWQMNQLLHWMLLWTKLKESLVEEVLLSQLAGYDHRTLSCLILIVMISMCLQHLVYCKWQSQSMVVITVQCLLWLRTPVMCAQPLHSPCPSQPETGVRRMVPLLLHPTPSVSFGICTFLLFREGLDLPPALYGQVSRKSRNQGCRIYYLANVLQVCVTGNHNSGPVRHPGLFVDISIYT